jgi:hypothetical protein
MKEIIMAAVVALAAVPAVADVTVQDSIALDVAGLVKAHGSTTELTTSDKQRRDSEFHCEGFMSLFCGNTHSGEIIRLDRDLSWQLRPDKKVYTETAFPTPEERALAQQKLQETLDQMKQCQQSQAKHPSQNKGDTSDCDMSPPKFDVKPSDEHATIAGHDARKTSVKLSQTCTNRKTGDVCEFVYGFDLWLTQDALDGLDERRAFQKNYLSKMGLDPNSQAVKGVVQQFTAQYATQMKQVADKAGDLKGYPLRSTFRLIIGGPNCSKAKSSDDSGSAPSAGGGLSGLAASAGGKLLSGFLSKHSAAGNSDSSQSAIAANSAPTLPDGYAQVIAFTTETTAVTSGAISPEQFEIPAGWTLEKPKPNKSSEFSCPTADK